MNGSTVEQGREGRSRLGTAALLLAGVVSLWLLRSSVIEVYGEIDEVGAVDRRWLVAILGCEVLAFTAAWELNRLALRTDRWFDVAVAQLSGNAATNVIPAGAPVGAAVQLRILSEAGFDLTSAATSLGALSLVGAAGLLAVPAIALPFALAAGDSDRHLEVALALGVGLLVALLALGAVLLRHDAPLRKLAGVVQWVENAFRSRAARRHDLPGRVLAERDSIREA
ncbi:MAG: lysylphosphatidylglycerol synthase domain-containing protein, partial [Acidimicrobiales bacterium]